MQTGCSSLHSAHNWAVEPYKQARAVLLRLALKASTGHEHATPFMPPLQCYISLGTQVADDLLTADTKTFVLTGLTSGGRAS